MILSLNGGSAAQQTNKLFWITAVWSNINFVIYAYVLVYVYTVHMLKTKQNKKTEFKRKKFLKNISRIIFAVQVRSPWKQRVRANVNRGTADAARIGR